MNLSIIIFKVNLINNSKQWWVDNGVTRYVWAEKMIFFTYKEVNVEYLYIGNSLKPKVLDIGQFILKITSKKRYILKKSVIC